MINVTQTFLPPLEEYTEYLKRIWENKWLTNRGVLVRELEEKLKDYLGIENLLAVNNGTVALQIAIKALGLTGEIITTPFSYVATVSSIVWEGCKPVFVDIDPAYLTIDETKIEAAVTENTSAILATHVYGNPCNVESIQVIAERHGLKVIYDAAHCFGVRYKGESILNWGDVSTLSFHATKLFHTGEGGGIVCRDKALFDKIFYHHNFGHRGEEEFWGLGVNAKISEINAAMGLAVLPYLSEIYDNRKTRFNEYLECLVGLNLETIKLRPETDWNYSYFPVLFSSEDEMLSAKCRLNDSSIFPRRYFYPSLNQLPYLEYSKLEIAESVSRRIICLPLSASLSAAEVELVCTTLKGQIQHETNIDPKELLGFLEEIGGDAYPPLGDRVKLTEYANKLTRQATCLTVRTNGRIRALSAFYSNDLETGIAFLTLIAVDKSMRNKGLARRLLDETIVFSRKSNMKKLVLETHLKNKSAVRLYKSYGFVVTQTENDGTVFMEYELDNTDL